MRRAIPVAIIVLMCGAGNSAWSQPYNANLGWGPVQQPLYSTGLEQGRNQRIGPVMAGDGHGPGMGPDGFKGRVGRELWRSRYSARFTKTCEKFLDETAGLRKDLSGKRFDYYEALRNPSTSSDALDRMEKEMSELDRKISAVNTHHCWWY